MEKEQLNIKSLQNLCAGNYSKQDIRIVIQQFVVMTKSILLKQKSSKSVRFSEWLDPKQELDDTALDYIASLFARDESGIFIELNSYFSSYWNKGDKSIVDACHWLLSATVHQENIRLYESRDPFGRIFYRSLKYILSKHSDWEKLESNHGNLIITRKEKKFPIADEFQVDNEFHVKDSGATGLTKGLEECLKNIIEKYQLSVPVRSLLRIARKQNVELIPQNSIVIDDPVLQPSLEIHRCNTINEVDLNILRKYEKKKKLESKEREGFKCAIENILVDFHSGDGEKSYYEYLAKEVPSIKSLNQYQRGYRKQFEYVAKAAKRIFSANVKSDFNLK